MSNITQGRNKKSIRVTTVAIGNELHQKWTVAFDNPIASELDGLLRCDDVHTIDLRVCTIKSTIG